MSLSTWLFKRNYRDYKNLDIHERDAISDYMEENNTQKLESIITNDNDISTDMKRFIADIVAGRIKRPARRKPSTHKRDIALHRFVKEHLSEGHILRSNSKNAGAISLVADGTRETEDVVYNAYKRINKYQKLTLMQLGEIEKNK